MKYLVFLLTLPIFAEAKIGEVLVYNFDSEGDKITWSIAEQRDTTRAEAIQTLHTFKKNHSDRQLLVYVREGRHLEDWFLYQLERFKINYEIIEVKNKKIAKLESELQPFYDYVHRENPKLKKGLQKGIKDWWNSVYEKPSQTELSHGYVMGGIKGAIAAPFWFSSGVSPEIATLLTIGISLNELLQTRYMRTLDNIYLGRKKTDPDFMKRRSAVFNLALRSAVSLMFSYLWRSISGPVGQAHSVRSIQGNAELWANMIAKLPGAWMGSVKAEKLSRTASSWLGFLVFGVGASFLNNMDLTGKKYAELINIPPIQIGDMVIYEFSAPLIILFGAVTATTLVIKYGPTASISTALEKMDTVVRSITTKSLHATNSVIDFIRKNQANTYTCQGFFH